MSDFDDSRLEDRGALAAADHLLRPLAEAGARVRREAASAELPLSGLDLDDRPRAMIIFGPEARLLRAVLEPICPVPLVAWPRLGLPGWVGPLDLVVVMGGGDKTSLAAAFEAVRRGCRLLVVSPPDSLLARQSASASTTLLPTTTGDPLAAAIVALGALHRLGLGPQVNPESVASAMDQVAMDCSLTIDATQNPAKAVALELADAQPLVWGGSILAARASRRIAEALRSASGRVVLSADAGALAPLLAEVSPRDPFADPFEEAAATQRPGLVLVDDDLDDEHAAEERDRLRRYALAQDVLISTLHHNTGTEVERYVSVLQKGLFAAAYLQLGLGRA
ncbi:MAG TPA: SIS domain-containing protein [Propionicimonas sp.]|nr:SIS domain-containing protein [Propionicimonas sp.]HQA77124.1 SIS domain-containing protein [Propionicimonas sp.]HQD96329.1 SIS domain-containing protein [Propionicimonas sp.]